MSAAREFRLIAKRNVGALKPMLKDLNEVNMKMLDDERRTLFHAAIRVRSRPILSMLIEYNKKKPEDQRCDLDARDGSGHTPLDRAVIREFKTAVELLVREGASVWHCQHVTMNTPLHIAATHGASKIVSVLLRTEGAREHLNATNEFGYTAIHNAVINGRYTCYTLLRNAGADLTLTTNNGDSLVHIAARTKDMRFIEELLEFLPEADLLLNNNKETAAICAKMAGHRHIQRMLVARRPEIVRFISVYNISSALDYTSIVEEREESMSRSASSSSCE